MKGKEQRGIRQWTGDILNGVNREEPETTTLLPFCDELFIYSNDDNERVNSVIH